MPVKGQSREGISIPELDSGKWKGLKELKYLLRLRLLNR